MYKLTSETINLNEAKHQISGMRTDGFTLNLPFFMLHFVPAITDFLSRIRRIKTYFLEPKNSRKILFGEYSQTLRVRVIEQFFYFVE